MQYDPTSMHRLDDNTRVDIGTLIEEWARIQVNRTLTRYHFEATTSEEDRRKKQDWKAISNGKRMNVQFKSRNTGNDILVSVWQPYFGPNDERNVWARDMVGEDIHFYVTYPLKSDTIYISRAEKVKSICQDLLKEWRSRSSIRLPFYSNVHADLATKSNPRPACCQLRFKIEEGQGPRRGEHKILAFLPPHLVPHWKVKVDPRDLEDFMKNPKRV